MVFLNNNNNHSTRHLPEEAVAVQLVKSNETYPSHRSMEKGDVEVILEDDLHAGASWCTVEHDDPPMMRLQPVAHEETKASVRHGTFVYAVVTRQSVAVHQTIHALNNSMMKDARQEEHQQMTAEDEGRDDVEDNTPVHDEDDKPTVFLKYTQMIHIDQVIQTNTIRKDHNTTPRASIVLNPTEIVRLADTGAWAVAEWSGKQHLKAVPVEVGLWCWYVHYNCAAGLVPTPHPSSTTPESSLSRSLLLPLQKIYCDAKVVNTVTGQAYYRLQTKSSLVTTSYASSADESASLALEQATQRTGWVCETLMDGRLALLAPAQVEMDRHLVICNRDGHLSIRARPGPDDEYFGGSRSIPMGEMVAVQTLVYGESSTSANETAVEAKETDEGGNENEEMQTEREEENQGETQECSKDTDKKPAASFMQLADRSGWVLVLSSSSSLSTEASNTHAQEVPTISGNWKFRVMHHQGVLSYPHPSTTNTTIQDRQFRNKLDHYPFASILQCDLRVTHPVTGRTFYRLAETKRWVPSEHESAKLKGTEIWVSHGDSGALPWLAELFETLSPNKDGSVSPRRRHKPWNPDFVRGIAATVDGLNEVDELVGHSAQGCLSFEAEGGLCIQIFCSQRSVDTEIEHKALGKVRVAHLDCSAKDLRSILQKDRIELTAEMKSVDRNGISLSTNHEDDDEEARLAGEVDLRQELLKCDAALDDLLRKRREMITQLSVMDAKRQHVLIRDIDLYTRQIEDLETSTDIPPVEPTGTSDQRDAVPKDDRYEVSYTESVDTYNSAFESRTFVTRTDATGFSRATYTISESESDLTGTLSHDSSRDSQTLTTTGRTENETTVEEDGFETIYAKAAESATSTVFGKSRQLSYTCGECSKAFLGKYSRDLHCRQVHKIFCIECEKIFPSFAELKYHKAEANH